MKALQFDEIKKTWKEVARYNVSTAFSFELEIHKKLLNIFHVGPYYYYIFNCATAQIEYASEQVKKILGLRTTEDLTTEYLIKNMHPEDVPYFYDFESKVVDFLKELGSENVMKYKMSYDYRVKNTDGKYIRILQQSITIQSDDKGAVIRVLGVHTDISQLKKNGHPTLSFIGLDGQPSYYDVAAGKFLSPSGNEGLTRREKEVLKLVMSGLTSSQIAAALFITKTTVEGHRKNILRKTNCESTVALIVKMMQ
ncbi:MAG: LuxR C-terminal-related transcriptional regulator [Bacteroidota bacterium]